MVLKCSRSKDPQQQGGAWSDGLLTGGHLGQYFFGVPFGRDVVPDFLNLSVFTNPESHAHDSEESFSQEGFHAPGAVGLNDLEFGIGKQREVQLVFYFELGLRFDGIAAAAGDRGVQLFELADCVTKLGRFTRSTGGIRFREEIEDQIFSAKIRE